MPVTTRSRHQANIQAATSNQRQNVPQAMPFLAPLVPVPEPPALLPYENLRSYVQSAKVPNPSFSTNIPTICRKTDRIAPQDRNLLSIEPDSRLRLREIWVSRPPTMAGRVNTLVRKSIPNQPIPDAQSRGVYIRTANFNLAAPGFLTFIDPPSPVNHVNDVANLTMGILETAERVVNLVWPEESKGLAFTFPPPDCSSVSEADASICVPLFYQKMREQDLIRVTEPKVKMVVIVLAPWAIAMSDIYEMLTIGKLPGESNGTWPTFTRAQRVWAQIYQCCASQNCPFFILTTYDKWIFGSFQTSSGWSRVVTTTIMAHTDVRPSMLEWAIFWCVSALQISGGWSANRFLNSKNPEIAHPEYIQSADPVEMTDEEWLNRLYADEANEENEPLPVPTKVAGYDNVYVTHL